MKGPPSRQHHSPVAHPSSSVFRQTGSILNATMEITFIPSRPEESAWQDMLRNQQRISVRRRIYLLGSRIGHPRPIDKILEQGGKALESADGPEQKLGNDVGYTSIAKPEGCPTDRPSLMLCSSNPEDSKGSEAPTPPFLTIVPPNFRGSLAGSEMCSTDPSYTFHTPCAPSAANTCSKRLSKTFQRRVAVTVSRS